LVQVGHGRCITAQTKSFGFLGLSHHEERNFLPAADEATINVN